MWGGGCFPPCFVLPCSDPWTALAPGVAWVSHGAPSAPKRLGYEVSGLGYEVLGLGYEAWRQNLEAQSLGYMVLELGCED